MDTLDESRDSDELRRELYEVANDESLSLATKQERLLELGREYLDVENGHVERVDRATDTHEVVASVGGGADFLPAGTTLERATTYCRRTVEADSPVALSDAAEQGWADDPAYHEHGFACYLGTTVFVRGEVYGTVCFVSRAARPREFAPGEKALAELVARLLGRELERASSDAELTTVENKYASLVRAAPDAIFLASADGGEIVEANRAAAELTGYAPGELEGMPYAHLHPPADRDRYHDLFDRLLSDGGTTSHLPGGGHVEILTAGDERIPVEMSAAAVELSGDRYVQGIVRDVSDRVERQRTLERQTELFEYAQSLASVGGWEYDLRTGELYWTDEARRIHEVDEEYEPTVGAALDFYPGEHGERLREALSRTIGDGEPYDLELKMVTADGTSRRVRVQGTAERHDGETVRIRGTIRDVTERSEREAELRLKNRAMDEAGVGISIARAEAGQPLVYVNDAFTDLTGYDRRSALGENCRFLQGPATDPDAVAGLRAAIDAETNHHVELLNYRADGTPFWNELTVTPVENETGETTHFIGVQHDVTPRKRRERLAGVLNRVLRHDLRNDLSVVEGSAEVVADSGDGAVADHGETIRRTAGNLSAISEKARALERTLRDPVVPERRDLVPVVREVAAALEEAAPGATVECSTPAQQRALATDQLRTVLRELGENAIDHAGPEPHVELAVVPPGDDDRVRIEVRDDGPGLPDWQARVLRAGTGPSLDHADGLGLWLVNWLVTEMGGEVEATVGDGTTVTVALRREDDPDRTAPFGRVQSALGETPPARGDDA